MTINFTKLTTCWLKATRQVTLKAIREVLYLSRNISGLRREVICMSKCFTIPSVNKHNQWSTITWLTLLWKESENIKNSKFFRKKRVRVFFFFSKNMLSRIIMKKASRSKHALHRQVCNFLTSLQVVRPHKIKKGMITCKTAQEIDN